MSQKTNPLSLRLQKSNQNFISPWFSDFFFDENYQYQLETEKYINKLLKETQYSKAFLSAKNSYRKSNLFLIIKDTRAQQKERQLLFNLKKNRSLFKVSTHSFLKKINANTAYQPSLLKIQKQINSGYESSLPKISLRKGIKAKVDHLQKMASNLVLPSWTKASSLHTANNAFNKDIKSVSMKNQIRETMQKEGKIKRFFGDKDNASILSGESNAKSLLSLKTIFLSEEKGSSICFSGSRENFINKENLGNKILQGKGQKTVTDFVFSFRKKVRDNFLKCKQNYNSVDLFCFQNYGDFWSEKFSFYKNENNLKDLWKVNWENKVIKNNCFSLCEKIVKDNSLENSNENRFSNKHHFMSTKDEFVFPTFLSLLYQQKKVIKCELINSNLTSLFPITTHFEPIRFISDTQNVVALLDSIIALLEKRVPFPQIKSKLFQNLSKNLQIKGIRISCSGRLGGRSKKAQKAKMQSHQWGETSLNAFSSKVLFANESAYTPYGKVGIKIWVSFKEDAF